MTRQRFAALPNRSTPVSRMRVMRLTQLRMLGRDACQASQRFVTTFSMRARPPGRRSAYLPAPPNVCRRPRSVTVEASTWPCGSEPSTRIPSLPDLRLACKFSVFLMRRVRTKPPSCVRSAGLAAQECRNIENAFIDKISRRRWTGHKDRGHAEPHGAQIQNSGLPAVRRGGKPLRGPADALTAAAVHFARCGRRSDG